MSYLHSNHCSDVTASTQNRLDLPSSSPLRSHKRSTPACRSFTSTPLALLLKKHQKQTRHHSPISPFSCSIFERVLFALPFLPGRVTDVTVYVQPAISRRAHTGIDASAGRECRREAKQGIRRRSTGGRFTVSRCQNSHLPTPRGYPSTHSCSPISIARYSLRRGLPLR
jgi:hypothetical protein